MEQWLEILAGEVVANIPTLFAIYGTTVKIVMSLISMYSSKRTTADRIKLLSVKHQIWSVTRFFVVKVPNICTPRTCKSSLKHCLWNVTRVASLI